MGTVEIERYDTKTWASAHLSALYGRGCSTGSQSRPLHARSTMLHENRDRARAVVRHLDRVQHGPLPGSATLIS